MRPWANSSRVTRIERATTWRDGELGDILEDHGFVSVRTRDYGTIQRVRAKRVRRSSRTSSGTSMRNGVTSVIRQVER